MPYIETENFKLAAYIQGEESAERLAVVIPGLLDTKDYPHVRSHVDHLAGLGFLAVTFDMPGTWESGQAISEYTTTNCLQAINEVIWRYRRPAVAVGHSHGGRLATLIGLQNPQVTGFASIMAAPRFIRQSNHHDRRVVWKRDGTKTISRDLPEDSEQSRSFTLDYSFCEDAASYDSREGLGKCKKPKLFVYGFQDTVVKPAEVIGLYKVAAEPRTLKGINSDHDYRRHPDLIRRMNQLISGWLNESNLLTVSAEAMARESVSPGL